MLIKVWGLLGERKAQRLFRQNGVEALSGYSFEGKRARLHQNLMSCFNRFKDYPLTMNSQMFKAAILLVAEQLEVNRGEFLEQVQRVRLESKPFCTQSSIIGPLHGFFVTRDQIDKLDGNDGKLPGRILVRGSTAIKVANRGFMPVLKGSDLRLAIIGRLLFDLERFSLSSDASIALTRLIDIYECLENYEALPFTLLQITLSDAELEKYQELARQVSA